MSSTNDLISEPASKKAKVHKKTSYDPHYSDNWNTPKAEFEKLVPFVRKYAQENGIENLVIWDPFYNADGGTANKYLNEIFPDATIIHADEWVDLDDPHIPINAQEANLIITNPPYSKKNKLITTKWMKSLGLPFMSLMPMETTMLKCMRPILKDELQLVIPNGRICFEGPNGVKTGSAPLGTVWFCFGMHLEKALNFLD